MSNPQQNADSVWVEPIGLGADTFGPYDDEVTASVAMDDLGLSDATHKIVVRDQQNAESVASPIATASRRPVVDERYGYVRVLCQRGHIIASERRSEWAGSRAEMLAGRSEVACDRCPKQQNPGSSQ